MIRWRRLAVVSVLSAVCCGGVPQSGMMAKDAHPSVEVATIKPADPYSHRQGFHGGGGQVQFIENKSVMDMVMFAYGVHPKQIVDAPAWMSSERFDVHATLDTPGQPSVAQYQEMLRGFLEKRFGLKIHHDKRELSVYSLTVAKGGSKLTPSTADPDSPSDESDNHAASRVTLRYKNGSMDNFALTMQSMMDRPVLNHTELNGKYDFTLIWKPDMSAASEDTDAQDLFTAVQEQMGLKMTAVKDQADVLVIDAVQKPAAN